MYLGVDVFAIILCVISFWKLFTFFARFEEIEVIFLQVHHSFIQDSEDMIVKC